MHERGEKSPRFKYRVKLNLTLSYVIIAYLFRLYRFGAGPPPWGGHTGGPTRGQGIGPHAISAWLKKGRAHPPNKRIGVPRFTLYCLIQTLMVLVL